MADGTPRSTTSKKKNAATGTGTQAAQEENGSSAATVLLFRSRGESPLIITAPCGKITTRGTCSRFSMEPVHIAFGQDGNQQAALVRNKLKRRPSSPLEDVAKHLVDRSARKRQFSGHLTPVGARRLFSGNWSRQDESGLFKEVQPVPFPLCSPLPVGKDPWQMVPGSGAEQGLQPTSSMRSRLCTPMSSRKLKLKACRELKVRESQEVHDRLQARLLKEIAMQRRENIYRAWLNCLLLPSPAGKVLDLDELFATAASGNFGDRPRLQTKKDGETVAAAEKREKLSTVKCRIARRKVGLDKRGRRKSDPASLEIHLHSMCSIPELRKRLELGSLDLYKQREIVSTMLQLAKTGLAYITSGSYLWLQHVDDGRLRMKRDCPLLADIVLREKALKVLMSYNSAWLRLGLYVVLGVTAISSLEVGAQEAYAEVFLERHVLGDVSLAKSYATNKSIGGLYRDGYHDSLGRLILKRVLLLVLYLDRLKCQTAMPSAHKVDGLDGGSPPLFQPNCTIKSSREALAEFFSNCLCGEGDFLGHLSTLGYHVFYVQAPIVEYNFEIRDIATDLQDGIRLSRLAQLLSNDPALLNHLEFSCQASTRLRNCEIALKGLEEAGVPMEDGEGCTITPQDILSGGREKILSLLWNVVINLQLPALIDRHKLWEEILRIQGIQGTMKTCSFSGCELDLLLSWVQIICSTYDLAVTDFGASFADGRALCYLVNFYLPEKLPLQEVHGAPLRDTVIILQNQAIDKPRWSGDELNVPCVGAAAVQNFRLLRAVAYKFKSIPKELLVEDTLEGGASVHEHGIIIFLIFLCSELLGLESLLKVREQDGTASTWEAELRSQHIAPLQDLDMFSATNYSRLCAALKIQTWYRAAKQRKTYAILKAKVVLIQGMVRVWLSRKHTARRMSKDILDQALHLQVEGKVALIQATFRGWMQRKDYTIILAQIQKIQRTWRASIAHKNFLRMRTAALQIQRAWRTYTRLKSTVCFVIRIQAWWRGVRVRILVGRLKAAGTVVSKCYRAYRQRRGYRNFRAIVVRLQAITRGKIVRRRVSEYKNAALRIQRFFRYWAGKQPKASDVFVVKGAWRPQVKAAVTIQSAYRAWTQRKTYMESRACIVKLQSLQRSRIIRRKFLEYHHAAEKIQSAFRQRIKRRVSVRDTSARVIQCTWRSYWRRKIQLRAALKIQRTFRTWSHWRKTNAALKLQAAFRGLLVRKHVRLLQWAAVLLQHRYRSSLARLKCEKLQRMAAIRIQSWWRRCLIRKSLSTDGMTYQKNLERIFVEDNESKTVQVIRATIQMRRQKSCFLAVCQSAICIQRWWRIYLASKVKAAVNLQRTFRGWKARHSFSRIRSSAILIQAHWKGYQHRRCQNLQMLELRTRMKVTAENVENSMRLGNRLMEALENLLRQKTVSSILNTCSTIDYATQHSQFCCERIVEGGAIVKLLQLIQTTNRSPPHELVLKHALSILGHLARFPRLAKQLADDVHFMSTITEQLHMFRHKDEVFRSAWHVFRLVCTVPVGADLLERSPSVFRRLHLVAQNLEKKIDVQKRCQERLLPTAPSISRKAADRRIKEVTHHYHVLVTLINDVQREAERRQRCKVDVTECKVKNSSTKSAQRFYLPNEQRRKEVGQSRRVPLLDRSNF